MSQFRMQTNRLKDNMIIGKDIVGRNGVILVPQGAVVDKSLKDLLIRHFIEYVEVEHEIKDKEENENKPRAQEQKQEVRENFEKFKKKFEIAQEDIGNHLEDIVFKDKKLDVDSLIQSVNRIIEQAGNSVNLCDMLFSMKEVSEGVYSHSIRVALVNRLLSEWLNVDKEEKELLSLCGLLHDIGKLRISPDILNKTANLTPAETAQIEKHSIWGYNILKDKDIDFRIKQAVLTHHERLDGSGYPLKILYDSINKFSRITAVSDTYDTMTSRQPTRAAISPFDVVYSFEVSGYSKFDTTVLMAFLSNILNNFIHYKVLLSNGEIGEVIFINKSNLSRPLIKTQNSFLDLSLRKDLKIIRLISVEE